MREVRAGLLRVGFKLGYTRFLGDELFPKCIQRVHHLAHGTAWESVSAQNAGVVLDVGSYGGSHRGSSGGGNRAGERGNASL